MSSPDALHLWRNGMINVNTRSMVLSVLALVLGMALFLRYARAEDQVPIVVPDRSTDSRTDLELAVAIAVHEATWNPFDAAAITGIITRRAAGHRVSLGEELWRLHWNGRLRSDRATNPAEGDSRPWIGGLREDCRQPDGWDPEGGDWADYVQRCNEVFDAVRNTMADWRRHDPCYRQSRRIAYIWGGRRLDATHIERREREGFSRIYCGATSNEYMGRQ
jgi:hypothetical protein